jgi:hypothetical protein
VYDLKDNIELEILTDEGIKVCAVNHPTDEQWVQRFSKRYTLIRNLGNGQSEQKPMNREAADSALLLEIQINKEEAEFDEFEAVTLIEQLATCDVVDVIRSGGSLQITLNTILGEVIHYVKMPKQKELKYAIEASVKVRGGRLNTSTVTIFLSPTADLYDTIAERIEGYNINNPKEVPIIHKYKVIDVIQGEVQNISAHTKTKGTSAIHPIIPGPSSQG